MAESLIVIRSGATDYDLQGRIRGGLDMPLCPAGTAEARNAAEEMAARSVCALYVAPTACARETGNIVGEKLSLRPRLASGLRNLAQGLWEGMLVEDIRRRQPRLARQWQDNPWAVVPPEGELLEDACERVEDCLQKLLRRHPEGRVAIVVPSPLDSIVRWLVAGDVIGDLWCRRPGHEAVAELALSSQWSRPRAAARRVAARI